MVKGYLGWLLIVFGGASVASWIVEVLDQPEVISQLNQYSPWLGAHAELLSWFAMAVVALAIILLLIKVINQDS